MNIQFDTKPVKPSSAITGFLSYRVFNMGIALELKGKKFNRLTVIKLDTKRKRGNRYWLCRCNCGNLTIGTACEIKSGHKKSCGCAGKKLKQKMFDLRFYNIWKNMKARCNHKNRPEYKDYGGRGIKNEWKSFEEFREDMYRNYLTHLKKNGEKNTSIDRINNNGNYSKENCRWATRKEQSNNTRRVRLITYNNKTQCLKDWAKELKTGRHTIRHRLKEGLSIKGELIN